MDDLSTWIVADPRLAKVSEIWHDFAARIVTNDRLMCIYHGDLDGAIGKQYLAEHLHRSSSPMIIPYWVGTEEYDFSELAIWSSQQSASHAVILDISIVNSPTAVRAISSSARAGVLIVDHHQVNEAHKLPANVTLANPTPSVLPSGERPVPTFFFARKLAIESGLVFPPWLLVMAAFAEGVDEPFVHELESLARSLPEMAGAGSLRDRYRKSGIARASTLCRAAYSSTHDKTDDFANLIGAVAAGNIREFAEFRHALESRFGDAADEISRGIDTLVETWSRRIPDLPTDEVLVVIPVEGPHAVAGPVASILRGRFPTRVIASWIAREARCILEIRCQNSGSLNLVDILRTANRRVHLLAYGGHPSAAGATVSSTDFDVLIAELRLALSAATETQRFQ